VWGAQNTGGESNFTLLATQKEMGGQDTAFEMGYRYAKGRGEPLQGEKDP
jgi:hypothetical protein